MLEQPALLETSRQLTAVIHIRIPRSEIQSVMGPAISEILATLSAQGIAPAGACFSYHLQRPTDVFDFEVGFPVNQPITATGRVKNSCLPAGKIARTVYHGGYEGLGTAWGEFRAWIDSQDELGAQDSLWECYLTGPESSPDPAVWRTELNQPLTG